MSSFPIHTVESAPAAARETLEAATKKFGFLPNLLGELAAAPAALKADHAIRLARSLAPSVTNRKWMRAPDRRRVLRPRLRNSPLNGFRARITGGIAMSNLPIVCTLGPAAVEARREDLLGGLVRRAEERIYGDDCA